MLIQLPHIGLGSIKQNTLLKLFRPNHLHLYQELASLFILAPDIYDAVLFQRTIWNEFCRDILHTLDLMVLVKRQEGIE